MKLKITTVVFLVFTFINGLAQESDILTPKASPFQVGNNIEGVVKNSVNEVTGKVTFSIPLATIASRSITFPVNLTYDGASALDIAQQLNEYSPTGTVGVGFNTGVPRIIVDNKGTAARDDDEFFLKDDTNNTRLICTKKTVVNFPNSGDSYQEFETEKYVPYKIKYRIKTIDQVNSNIITTVQDYWEIINDSGVTYTYGNTDNTRENVIAWDNWIGSSKNTSGASLSTVIWNLSKIEDQWGNSLDFTYEKTEQGHNSSAIKHTEASYIKEITSSSGGKIIYNYGNKTILEYHEPHTEIQEPDAYQERYERKFLETLDIYDRAEQLINTYDFTYDYKLKALGERKMYLESLTFKDANGVAMPAHEFDYYTSGDFVGCMEKVTYPTGGSVTYNYENKLLYTNTANRYPAGSIITAGYTFYAAYARDNYVLRLYRSTNYVSGNKYRFKMVRHWWDGSLWQTSEFVLPPLISDEFIRGKVMDRFLSVFEEDYYGFLWFNRDTDEGDLYLFHLENDGRTWKESHIADITIESYNDQNKQEDPVLMSSKDFVMIGTNRSGRVYTYTWNGSSWNSGEIQQGQGQFYYGVASNYILALDEDGGPDMVTNISYPDNYYIHYLDAEKIWRTKSWSAFANTQINPIKDVSTFFADNSMAAFVAENNPEYILRWDKDYNLISVDDELGAYPDSNPIYPSLSSMFTIQVNWFNSYPQKSIRFNGSSWSPIDLNPNSFNSYSTTAFGEDFILMYDRSYSNRKKVSYYFYDPNNNNWNSGIFNDTFDSDNYWAAVCYNRDFIIAGNKIIKLKNDGTKFGPEITLPLYNNFSYSNTLNYSFVELANDVNGNASGGKSFSNSLFVYTDKKDGYIKTIDLGDRKHIDSNYKFGGYNPFMSFKSMFLKKDIQGGVLTDLYRIVDDQVNNDVYDVVVSEIEIDNGKGEIRKVSYTYNNPNSLPNDVSTFYGEVIVENKGFGNFSNGKIKRYFHTGEEDLRLAGLLKKTIIEDKNGNLKSVDETIWDKYLKNYFNSTSLKVGLGYFIFVDKKIETLTLNGEEVKKETDFSYDIYGMLTSVSKTNSKGELETSQTRYAFQQYSFVKNKNMFSFPYETKSVINGKAVAIERSLWKQQGGRVYVDKNSSGIESNSLRVNNETTRIDPYGNIQESNNGLGVFRTVIYANANLYPVAIIQNAEYSDVINELDVSYNNLQNLNNTSLEVELSKLYDRLPNSFINLTFYDEQGRIVRTLDERKEATNYVYDSFNRHTYTTDSYDKVIQKNEYNFSGN